MNRQTEIYSDTKIVCRNCEGNFLDVTFDKDRQVFLIKPCLRCINDAIENAVEEALNINRGEE